MRFFLPMFGLLGFDYELAGSYYAGQGLKNASRLLSCLALSRNKTLKIKI